MKNNNKKSNIGVFCHIYYSDLVTECMEYLVNIPIEYDLYISYSLDETGIALSEFIEKHNMSNCVLRKKNNRGRDVSSMLVTFRKDILQYKYFCFIHDKKSIGNIKDLMSAVKWRRLYFDCLLYDKEYIESIVTMFESDEKLGILTSPQPYENEFIYSFNDEWLISYDASVSLAKMLKMERLPQKNVNPITLGTSFWARTQALEKLLNYPFTYDDFPSEPMKSDGQLGHAVERMIGFIAEESGYRCEITMPNPIAQERARSLETFSRRLLSQMRKITLLKEEEYIDNWYDYMKQLLQYCMNKKDIYIYGAGFFGEKAVDIANNVGVPIRGFIVSDGYKEKDYLKDIRVYELSEVDLTESNIGVIIAVFNAHGLQQEVKKQLLEKGFADFLVLH